MRMIGAQEVTEIKAFAMSNSKDSHDYEDLIKTIVSRRVIEYIDRK